MVRASIFLMPFALAAGALGACGFDGGGELAAPADAAAVDPARGEAGTSAFDGGSDLDGNFTNLDGATGANDAADADAAAPHDAGPPLPTDPGLPLAYVVSTRFWTFDPTTGAWAGGTALPAGTCPQLDELAVDPFGGLFAVGSNATRLYRVDATNPSSPSCTAIGAGGAGYPQSLAFAPRGTLEPFDEALVGYTTNGDYVRLDTTTGAIAVVTAGALSGMAVGDLVNVGPDGYVAVNGGSCGSGDCVWKISLVTGRPISPGAASAKLPSTTHVTGLAHWAGKLQAFCGPDEVFSLDPANAAGAVVRAGPPGYTNVVYHGAGSRTIAPTN
jgi:hypothetical protein